MAYSRIDNKELLGQIVNNPSEAVAEQRLISAGVTYAVLTRHMAGILDRTDELQLSEEQVRAIEYIAEHDPLAFLMFINRFDLIRQIFWDEELFKKQLALLEKIEVEKAEAAREAERYWEEEWSLALSKHQKEVLAQDMQQHKLNEERILISIETYQYFLNRHHEIHDKFYKAQIAVFEAAYLGRMGRINQAIEVMENDPSIQEKDKQSLLQLKADYESEHKEARAIQAEHPGGVVDYEAREKQHKFLEQAYVKSEKALLQVLREYSEHKGLKDILAVEFKAVDQQVEELKRHVAVLREEVQENTVYLDSSGAVVKGGLLDAVGGAINIFGRYNTKQMSPADRVSFSEGKAKLAEYKSALFKVDDRQEIKEITQKFLEQAEQLKMLVGSSALSEELEKEIRFVEQFRSGLDLKQTNRQKPEADAALLAAEVKKEEIRIPEPQEKNPATEPESALQVPETEIKKEEIQVPDPQETSTVVESESTLEVPETIAETEEPKINPTVLLKEQNIQMRAEYIEKQNQAVAESIQNQLGNGELDETVELDEEQKNKLKELVNELSEQIEEVSDDLGPQIKQLCKEIKPTIKTEVSVSKLELLLDTVEKLSKKEGFEELTNASESIGAILDTLRDTPKLI